MNDVRERLAREIERAARFLRQFGVDRTAENLEQAFADLTAPASAGLEAQLADLRKEVREWLCEKCNYVWPGPPSEGYDCVTCRRCGGDCGPRTLIERRKAEAQLAEARGDLNIANLRLTAAHRELAEAQRQLQEAKELEQAEYRRYLSASNALDEVKRELAAAQQRLAELEAGGTFAEGVEFGRQCAIRVRDRERQRDTAETANGVNNHTWLRADAADDVRIEIQCALHARNEAEKARRRLDADDQPAAATTARPTEREER